MIEYKKTKTGWTTNDWVYNNTWIHPISTLYGRKKDTHI